MNFEDLKCVNENVNLGEYLELYNFVRNNMENKEWLGTFEKEEIIDILNAGGKIWIYYYKDKPVCSMFYIPVKNKTLIKHNIEHDEKIVGSLGPIMVHPDFVGKGFQKKMMEELERYCKNISKKYIFTKAHSDNVYSINNMLKTGYTLTNKWVNERGNMSAFIKEI